MFFVKIHKKLGREVLAICDEEILGKTLEEGDFYFEIKEDFYKGEKLSEEQVRVLLKNSPNYNLVGKEIIKIALDLEVVEKENIIKIKGVPHAQGFIV
ncbi:MAG: DUF424 family protein [Nanoarchaeota archaeon]